jgi:hypothetical protein
LLLDFTPAHLSSRGKLEKSAVGKLLQSHRIALSQHPYPGVSIDLSSRSDHSIVGLFDRQVFETLTRLSRKNSTYSSSVPWEDVVAVGYNTARLPMGGGKMMDSVHGLSVFTLPKVAKDTEMEVYPVGMLDDLDKWVARSHQRSLNPWAGVFLTSGFLLQLCLSFAAALRGS